MRLVEVDRLGLQASQRAFDGGLDRGWRQAPVPLPLAQLGRQRHPRTLAAALEPASQQGFGLTALVARYPVRVRVGGIDQVEAGVDESIQQGEGCRLVGTPAEHVAAQGERGDVQAGSAEGAQCGHGDAEGE